MHKHRSGIFYLVLGGAWAIAVAAGLSGLWKYELAAGAAAQAPSAWPPDSQISRDPRLPTLVLLTHPRCPCSRATISELARLMAECQGRLTAKVLMIRPRGMPDGWEKQALWEQAAVIPGVSVISDPEGVETSRFGAATSGQAILFDADGALLFAGGMTESRGHEGDNAGRSAIAAIVQGRRVRAPGTPVYGCPLFNEGSTCSKEGTRACPSK